MGRSYYYHQWRRHTTILLLLVLQILENAHGYYVGEYVDTVVMTSFSGKEAAVKAQCPRFGTDSNVKFPRSNSNGSHDRFSLGFEEGYHQLSWINLTNLGKLKVTFIYSKSGDGIIASVSSEPIMKSIHEEYSRHYLEVEYRWIEEEKVDFQAGVTVMFFATFLVSILLVLQVCVFSDDGDPVGINSQEYIHGRRDLLLHDE